jgi:hypothetical protein
MARFGLSTAAIVLLVLFIIFLILAAVFIGLYVWGIQKLNNCQSALSNATNSTCPTCPTCPACPSYTGGTGSICPEPSFDNFYSFASGTAKGETVTMTCPSGMYIGDYQLYTSVVDGGPRGNVPPEDISSSIAIPLGANSFCEPSSKILSNSGISPFVDACGKFLPTRVLYGSYSCATNPSVTVTQGKVCPVAYNSGGTGGNSSVNFWNA